MQNVFDAVCTLISDTFPGTKIYFSGIDSSIQVSIDNTFPEAKIYCTGTEDGFDIPSILVTLAEYEFSNASRNLFKEKLSFKITQHYYSSFLDRNEGKKQIEEFIKLRDLFCNGLLVNGSKRAELISMEAGMNQQDMYLIVNLERMLEKDVNEGYEIIKTLEYNQHTV
jgi:hypothetical protein